MPSVDARFRRRVGPRGGYDARWEIGGANAQELAGVVSLGSWILLARA
jgi:hypothetical protein